MIASDKNASIDDALASYFEKLDEGGLVDETSLLARYPQHAAKLQAFFRDQLELNAKVRQLGSRASGGNRLTIRCPNCNQPTEVAADSSLTDVKCSACGSRFSLIDQSATTTDHPTEMRLGRFRLVERVGMGAFGSVWKAQDDALDRTVAIKIPRKGRMTPSEQEKFFREARAAAQLRHPNIVSVHEVGRDGDSIYIVSDFVRGVTLADWLSGQRPTNREAAEMCAKIADALHHAHEHGVVHRDLKPANIMLDADGEPHLMDFGLARREMGEVTMTMDGHILGTPAYMSPEQAVGKGHVADRCSDVYSLGVILFQLLTDELPFRGNARMLMHQVIHDEPPSPRKLNSQINRDLETITLKCLEKLPSQRYQTAREVAGELRRFLSNEPIIARPINRLARSWRWCKRYPTVAVLLSAFVLTLLAGTAISSLSYLRAERSRLLEQRTAAALAKEKDVAESALLDSQRSAYLGNLRVAHEAFERGDDELARSSLQRCPETLRRWEWRYLNWQLDHSLSTLQDQNVYLTSLAFTPNGDRLLVSGIDRTVRIWSMRAKSPHPVVRQLDERVFRVATSPDNKHYAVALGGGAIKVLDIESGRTEATLTGHKKTTYAVCFSPNGELVASGGSDVDPTVAIWDWKHNKQLAIGTGHTAAVWSVAFNPDGKSVASGSYDKTVRFWGLTGKPIHTYGPYSTVVNSVGFSPDGSGFASGRNGGTVTAWRMDTKKGVLHTKMHDSDVNAVAFSPDGKLLATASKDQSISIVDAFSGAVLNRLTGHTASVIDVAFSPDGASLASCDREGAIKFWDFNAIGEWACSTESPAVFRHIYPLSETQGFLIHRDGQPIQHWELAKSTATREFSPSWQSNTNSLAASSDNSTIAFKQGRKLVVVSVADGKTLAETTLADSGDILALSHNGRCVYGAVARSEKPANKFYVYAFNPAENRLEWTSADCGCAQLAIGVSPDAKQVWSSGANRKISVWEASSGTLLRTLTGSNYGTYQIQFSPVLDVAATSDERTIRLWRVSDGKPLRLLKGHQETIYTVAFHPTEPRLASVAADGTLRVWDTESGQQLLSIDVSQHMNPKAYHSADMTSDSGRRLCGNVVQFTADGSTLLVGNNQGNLWQLYSRPLAPGFPPLEPRKSFDSFPSDVAIDKPSMLNAWAWHLTMANNKRLRDGKLAVAIASKACQLTDNKDAAIIDTLAAAYAESGDFEKAVETEQRALAALGPQASIRLRDDFTRVIEAYKAKHTRHDLSETNADLHKTEPKRENPHS